MYCWDCKKYAKILKMTVHAQANISSFFEKKKWNEEKATISQSSIVSGKEVWQWSQYSWIHNDRYRTTAKRFHIFKKRHSVWNLVKSWHVFFFDSLMIWQLSLQIPFHNITMLCLRPVLVFFNCFVPDWNVLTIFGVMAGAFGKHIHGLQRVKLIKTTGPR